MKIVSSSKGVPTGVFRVYVYKQWEMVDHGDYESADQREAERG